MAQTVADIMERSEQTVHCQSSIADAERLLASRGLSGAPMVSTDGHVLGVVSITDITRFRYEHAKEDPTDRMVFEIGTPVTITVSASATLQDAARDLSEHQVHRLVVVRGGVPVGIVTALDIVAQVARGNV
ncbi:MAG: CBS domain-containing protein [Deltaproteobacteria bacterium]|jgi:CBS domain-containing protein|nr:CBS domain-containing protein [Deltaproteobacteria bacterium]MBW2694833.1 CBS domain-containing protein [Deltaproteobacteria bacterium]